MNRFIISTDYVNDVVSETRKKIQEHFKHSDEILELQIEVVSSDKSLKERIEKQFFINLKSQGFRISKIGNIIKTESGLSFRVRVV